MSILKSERDEIRLLKAKGLSQRKIAWMTGHSRNTVADVLGTLADDDSQRHKREARRKLAEAPPEKCPGCGRKVTMPCPGCLARNYLQQKRLTSVRTLEEPIDRRPPPGIELADLIAHVTRRYMTGRSSGEGFPGIDKQ